MLFKSGINLESSTIEFITQNNSITLFSPYLILKELERINSLKRISQIVVRWEIQDLFVGVSNFELYDYCKQNNIILYRNTRIHLKAFWNNNKSLILGSANVTQKGLGEKGEYNFELNTQVNNISPDDILYLYKIIQDSQLMTDELYQKIKDITSQIEIDQYTFPTLKSIKTESDYFLLSDLPMSESPDKLFLSYTNQSFLNDDEIAFSTHDFALYKIPKGLNQLEFMDYLNNKFNTHPFIIALKNEIKNSSRKSMNYGSVVRWIQNNTTTVPIPRSWDIKREKIVNILYVWICFFDDEFSWNRPRHSEVIYYKINYQ